MKTSNSNDGVQIGIGIEIDLKTKFIAKIGAFDIVFDSDFDPDSVKIGIADHAADPLIKSSNHANRRQTACP